MPFSVKPYESEMTQFLKQLRREDPTLETRQRQGRERLWERQLDRDAQQGFRQARTAQKGYVYR